MRAKSIEGIHHRTCPLCEAMCGIDIEVRDGAIASIRGDEADPFSRGHICPKAAALKDLHEDPDRLKQPMLRVGDRFEPIGWEEALDRAAEGIHAIQQEHGRNAVAMYLGNPAVHNLGALTFGPQLLRSLRTKNRYSATSVDQLPHMFASYHMLGHQLLLPVPDIDRCNHLLILGANPLASNGSIMSAPGVKKRLEAIKERGGKVVVVDPRRTETARLASRHHFIKPASDAFFLLGLLHHVLHEAQDTRLGRLAPICVRLEELREATLPFSPDRVAPRCGVEAEAIRQTARELLESRRAAVYGRVGVCTQRFGGLAAWLINALNLVTGHFDEVGGVMFTRPAVDVIKAVAGFGVGKGSHGRWKSRVRGLAEFGGELPVVTLAEEILTPGQGRIRSLITLAGNPVLSTPNGRQLDEALSSLDLMIAIDPFINETTRHADLIIPPAGPLEHGHYDLALAAVAVRNTAKFSPALFDAAPGQLDDGEILIGLVTRLEALRHGKLSKEALRARALEAAGAERILDVGLRIGPYRGRRGPEGKGLSLRRLLEAPHGLDLGALVSCLPERLPKGRETIDLAPEPMLDDLLRLRKEPELRENDLLLIGRRQLRSNNSWMHNAPTLMRGKNRCTLMIHPDDAERVGVQAKGRASIASRVGTIEAPVEITTDIMRGVVSLPHGFGHDREGVQLRVARENAGVSVNDLTDERDWDRLTGNASLSGVPVQVEPA